jgi:hypothetical protein
MQIKISITPIKLRKEMKNTIKNSLKKNQQTP